jgi:eukaryotic-like serine/threonine-protein kinase
VRAILGLFSTTIPGMGELTGEQIAQRVTDLNLLSDRQLQEVWGEFARQDVPGDDFLQMLVRRELLTNYQVERLVNGDRTGFFYGDYKALYRVATGSFARVYRAVHKENGKVVALKVLRKRYCDDATQVEHFLQEGELGRSLRHPNIVPTLEVRSQGREHYLVLEFIEGGNLRDFIRIRKKIEPAEATRLIADTAAGLQYAFDRGISHRDLKLTNVLISSRGQAKLVDFGLAGADEGALEDPLTNPRTIDYAGLERATGARKDDNRSDIYFLGCIYYHLLTGEPALQETKDRIQRLSRSRYADVVPIHRLDPQIPRVVAAICNKSMELDPTRRYQSPGEMLVDLNIAQARLAAGETEAAGSSEPVIEISAGERKQAARYLPDSQRKILMFVESDSRMQDIFRDGLKRCGYRVLLTSDPERALARFTNEAKAADCVVFSSGKLGSAALEAFNRFGVEEATRDIPAVLLLGEKQGSWRAKAEVNSNRVVLSMPIKLRDLRGVLGKLAPAMGEAADLDDE